mmetsp:Transcript_5250/g.12639  ORF Transcript_5250/g.12639 Transcript_5250/m.12639 type:complete len:634 (-) Transcript_5250:60-1961(-)
MHSWAAFLLLLCWSCRGEESPEVQKELLLEIQRLRQEVAQLKEDKAAVQDGTAAEGDQPEVPIEQVGIPQMAKIAPTSGATASKSPDACLQNPMFAALHAALQRLALLEQDPVEASYKIHAAWEEDPSIFDTCPVGVITALVYLSIAQDREWKYRLLHRATYLLYSTAGLAQQMANSKWPMSDRLIRTMYHNSEVAGRSPIRFEDEFAQASSGQAVADLNLNEAISLALRHRDTKHVHFRSVLFYHFYFEEESPCACRTRSWCLPYWLRFLTNQTLDIWLAARDEAKTMYRMDRSGCFRKLPMSLAEHYFVDSFDLLYVFEINALMHPRARIISAKRILLTPAFALLDAQRANFEELGVSVLADDAVLKPPNPQFQRLLDEAWALRQERFPEKVKDRLLLFPADIRPLKGQVDFLTGLLLQQAQNSAAVQRLMQRLKFLTIVIAGRCDGNQTYCTEVVELSKQVNNEGVLNIVVADALKDEELTQLYAASAGVVLYSRIDCNPRAVYEALWTDTPFFVTGQTRLPAAVQHLGYISDGNPNKLAEELADFVDFCQAGGFSGRPLEFAQRHLTEAPIYESMVEWMDSRYLDGKVLDPVILSEDASGLAGGLSQLLGSASSAGAMLGQLGKGLGGR